MLLNMVFAFVTTAICEGALCLLILKNKYCLWPSFLCNLLTNPLLNAVLLLFFHWYGYLGYNLATIALEISIIPVEGLVLKALLPISMKKAVLTSWACNAFSFVAGFVLYCCGLL